MASVVGNVQSGLRFATLPGLIRDAELLKVCSRFLPYIGQFSSDRTFALASNTSATTSPTSNRAGRIVSSLITGLALLSCCQVDAAETVIHKPDVNTSGHFMNSSGQQREREAERVEQGYGDSLAHFRTSSGTRWRPMNPDPPKTVIGPAM